MMSSLLRVGKFFLSRRVHFSSFKNETKITVTDDGQTIVCWHPAQPCPYQYSLPYTDDVDIKTQNSVFKVENIEKGENIHYKSALDRYGGMEELQAITFTPKHVWEKNRFHGLQLRPKPPRKGV